MIRMTIKGWDKILLEIHTIWWEISLSIGSLYETFIRAFFVSIIRIPPIRHFIFKWSKAFYQTLSKAWLALCFLLNICRWLIIIRLVNISFPSIIITITPTTTKTSEWPAKLTQSSFRRIVRWFCRHIEFSSLGIKFLRLRNLPTNLSSRILGIRFTIQWCWLDSGSKCKEWWTASPSTLVKLPLLLLLNLRLFFNLLLLLLSFLHHHALISVFISSHISTFSY